jgi:electron transfer flavoprotein beta subunit
VKVLVPVKQVARLGEDLALAGPVPIEEQAEGWELNEWDTFSLEAAVKLAEGSPGGEVLVATVGPERAEDALLACLAKGADRAARIWDPVLEGADPLGVAAVLAALAATEALDLILCGAQSSDAANAATGVALAGLLDVSHVAVVDAIERDGDRLTVQRELEGGRVEVLRVRLPALLTVQTQINEPRRATLRDIKRARAKPLATLGLSELGLDRDGVLAAAGSRTVALAEPERGEGARMLEGSPGQLAARIAELVRADAGA